MPFKQKGLVLFRDWEPDEHYDPYEDRLLVTTDWGDTLVASLKPEGSDSLNLIVDPEYMPENLAEIPRELRYHSVPLNWVATKLPWFIFLYDGAMTGSGPLVETGALHRWHPFRRVHHQPGRDVQRRVRDLSPHTHPAVEQMPAPKGWVFAFSSHIQTTPVLQ